MDFQLVFRVALRLSKLLSSFAAPMALQLNIWSFWITFVWLVLIVVLANHDSCSRVASVDFGFFCVLLRWNGLRTPQQATSFCCNINLASSIQLQWRVEISSTIWCFLPINNCLNVLQIIVRIEVGLVVGLCGFEWARPGVPGFLDWCKTFVRKVEKAWLVNVL